MKNILKGSLKALYTIGSIANAVTAVAVPNPVSTPILVSQVLGAVLSTKVKDQDLGSAAGLVNGLGFNFGEACNDISSNYKKKW